MRPTSFRRGLAALLFASSCLFGPAAYAQAEDAKPPAAEAGRPAAGFEAERTVTTHRLGELAYTATAEFLPLRDGDKEEVQARVFTITYTANGGTADGAEAGKRPVAFVFNGGPGASSAYLHLGALGPKVVAFKPDGALPTPPAPLVDNPDSWLAFTDLVFIDPVGTGYSRGLKPGDDAEKKFWSPEGDSRSLSEAVRLWLTRNGRWSSPKFLVGESYGGFRIAKMAEDLLQGPGVAVNGLIMVSPVVDFASIFDSDAGLLPWVFRLPAYTAAAWAHGKISGDGGALIAEAERFALTTYLSGLATLDLRNLAASEPLFAEVARLTGLPVELVRQNRGRLPGGVFAREILREDGKVVSGYDATFTGLDADPAWWRVRNDPFLDGTKPVYATAYASYVRDALGVKTEVPFRLLSGRVNGAWEWPRMAMPSAADDLQSVLALQPSLRVMIAHGRTDLVTPYMASRWIARNLELPADGHDRVTVPVYNGGHMMYTLAESRRLLFNDARTLVEAAMK